MEKTSFTLSKKINYIDYLKPQLYPEPTWNQCGRHKIPRFVIEVCY